MDKWKERHIVGEIWGNFDGCEIVSQARGRERVGVDEGKYSEQEINDSKKFSKRIGRKKKAQPHGSWYSLFLFICSEFTNILRPYFF